MSSGLALGKLATRSLAISMPFEGKHVGLAKTCFALKCLCSGVKLTSDFAKGGTMFGTSGKRSISGSLVRAGGPVAPRGMPVFLHPALCQRMIAEAVGFQRQLGVRPAHRSGICNVFVVGCPVVGQRRCAIFFFAHACIRTL